MGVMMGDLVHQEEKVNPVMSALLDRGLEVTAVQGFKAALNELGKV
jgi:hypothetical protein